ncbi:MAG: hypothetical protein D6754_00920 [Alphaproteobacteria bacterium]|nr:MAG: hypothetical protein D6754_00920 [Alphaproteobacteria bacterium]
MSGQRSRLAGIAAEEQAERLYRDRNGTVLDRRWSCREGEIDLVVRDGGPLVFAEVRARRSLAEAAFSLTAAKWARLKKAALAYLAEHGLSPDSPMRFDVVLVSRMGETELIENALPY